MNASAQPISPFHHHSQQSQSQQQSQQSSNDHHQQSSQNTTLRRGPWSPEEDRKLLESINLFGATNWVRISQSLGSRTPKQCRERYHQNLKPSLNRNPITPEEGQLIEELVGKYGKRWAEIARHLNGRSDNAIKNWWNGGANRRRRASSQAILQETSHHHLHQQPLPHQHPSYHPQVLQQQQGGHHPIQPSSDYSQQIVSPAFNTQIFQQKQYEAQQAQAQAQHHSQQPLQQVLHQQPPLTTHLKAQQTLPPLQGSHSSPAIASTNNTTSQQPLALLSSISRQHMLPPVNSSRSVSMNQEIFQQQPGVKRLLEEQNIPVRRHSTQTIMTSGSTSSPFSGSPLSRGPSSRNSSISYEYSSGGGNNQNSSGGISSGYFSEYSNNTSRRSSIAPDIFPNPFQYQNKRQGSSTGISVNSSNVYLSPNFKPHRGSASGLPSNLSTLSTTNSTTPTNSTSNSTPTIQTNGVEEKSIFKTDFAFDYEKKVNDGDKIKEEVEEDETTPDGKKKVMDITNLLG